MKDFLNKTWVKILSWVFIAVGTVVLLLGGTKVGDVTKGVELIFGILEAIGLLVAFIRGLLSKKETAEK